MLCELNTRYSRKIARKLSERGKRMAKVRWDKFRATVYERPEPDPHFIRAYKFEIGIRNKDTGETFFVDLKSGRQAHKIAGLILKYL